MAGKPQAVSHLPSSSSFYLACLQPLGYKYIDQRNSSVGFGRRKGGVAEYWITQASPSHPAGATHAVFNAADHDDVVQFFKCAIRAGAHPCIDPTQNTGAAGICSALVQDLDGNLVEVVYQPNVARNLPAPVVRAKQKSPPAAPEQKGGGSQHGKTIVGTLIGAAAGAAVAYAMYKRSSRNAGHPESAPASPTVEYEDAPDDYPAVRPPQHHLANEEASVWDDDSIASGSRVQTVHSRGRKSASVAREMEGLENSTAAWSIRDDDDANAYYAPKKFDYHEHANPWGPSDGSSAYLSDYHATTVYSSPTVKGAPSDARSARIPYERSRTGVPSDYQSVASKRTGASTKVPSVQPAGVASKMKSILKPSSTTPQGPTFLDEEAMMARHTEATKASHRSQRPERSSRSSGHRSSHSRAPSQSRTSRKDYDPYQGHSSGEETYHGAYQPVNVAPGKAYPNPKGGKGAFDYESEMTAAPSNAGSRASKAQTYKSHRSHRSHRSHSRAPSMSGRSSNGRRSKLDEELRPEDSISQVC